MVDAERPEAARYFRYEPTAQQVEDLIRRAHEHPLGTDYLLHGYLDSVAATFKVHGFTVEHARERMRQADMEG